MANQKRKRNINWKLPEHIVKVIFSKLSFSDLLNCRTVCKAWNDLVLDYANNSYYKSLFHPNAFLVCIYDVFPNPHPSSYYTCNPKIHCFDFDTTNSVAALGFDDDCESIVIHGSCNGLLQITLSTSEFDEIVGILNPMTKEFADLTRYDEDYWFGFGSIHCDGVYFDGVIYWIGKAITSEFVIYGLDVETEVFETIAIVDLGPYSTLYHTYLQQFNATIYLIIRMDAPLLHMQVWITKDKYSWIQEFVIDLSADFRTRKFHFIKVSEDEQTLSYLENNDLFYFNKSQEKITIYTKQKLIAFFIWNSFILVLFPRFWLEMTEPLFLWLNGDLYGYFGLMKAKGLMSSSNFLI